MRITTLIVLLLAATLVGCNNTPPNKAAETSRPQTSSDATPAEQAHNLIVRYNQLLSEGYKTTNMTKLQEVATPELAEKA